MASNFDIKVKEIETVGEIIQFLRQLDKGDVLANYPGISQTCQSVFAKIGALDDFDPTKDPKALAKIIQEGVPKQELSKEIGDFLDKQISEDTMGSRSLRADQAEALIQEQNTDQQRRQIRANLQKQTTDELKSRLKEFQDRVDFLNKRRAPKEQIEVAKQAISDVQTVLEEKIDRANLTDVKLNETQGKLERQKEEDLARLIDEGKTEEIAKRIYETKVILEKTIPTQDEERLWDMAEEMAETAEIEHDTKELIEVVPIKIADVTAATGLGLDEALSATEQLNEIADKADNFDEIDKQTEELLNRIGITKKEAIEEVIEIVEAKKAAEITLEYKNAMVEQALEVLIADDEFNKTEVENIREKVEAEITAKILNPSIDLDNDSVEVRAISPSNIKATVTPSMKTVLKEVEPKKIEGSKINEATKGAQSRVEGLYDTSSKSQSKRDEKKLTTREAVMKFRQKMLESRLAAAAVVHHETITREENQMMKDIYFPPHENGQVTPQINPEAARTGKVVAHLIKSPEKLDNLLKKGKSISEKAKGVKAADALGKVVDTIEKTPGLKNVLEMVRKGVAFRDKFTNIPGKILMRVGKAFGFEGFEQMGVNLLIKNGGTLGVELASHISALGLEKGMWNAMITIIKTGKVGMYQVAKTGAATAVKAGATAAGTAAVEITTATTAATISASTIAGIPIAVVILAATAAWEFVKFQFRLLKKGIQKVSGVIKDAGLQIGLMKGTLQDLLGQKLGGFVSGVLDFGALLIMSRVMIMGIFTAVIAAVPMIVMFTFGYMAFSQQNFMGLISSLIPNRGPIGGGMCINIDAPGAPTSATINCDPNVPDQSGKTTVDKENFIDVAERWRAGGGENAERCFNDVVQRAVAASVNADYALWAWLHESGASNYTGFGTTYDFGVVYKPANDFSAQIDEFLLLDGMGEFCNPPLDYWLSFATNFLTGGCDPDKVVDGTTGRAYLAEMILTWGWITNAPMPATIHVPASGESGGDGMGDVIVIDEEDGSTTICEQLVDSTGVVPPIVALPTLDPNIEIPPGCPDAQHLPVKGGYFTQGPFGRGCSHETMPSAVDIGIATGNAIYATHDGVARVASNGVYGNYVDVTGICNGGNFTTRYAHMLNATVGSNVIVKAGQQIGIVNNTGSSSGAHLHYDFRGATSPNISATLGASVDLTGCCIDGPIKCPLH